MHDKKSSRRHYGNDDTSCYLGSIIKVYKSFGDEIESYLFK